MNLLNEIKWQWRRLKLWLNISKRRKFARALRKYEAEIQLWNAHNDGPPPIVWYPPDNDYIWATREMRKKFQKRIRNSLKRGE